jgi:hypothetical protein
MTRRSDVEKEHILELSNHKDRNELRPKQVKRLVNKGKDEEGQERIEEFKPKEFTREHGLVGCNGPVIFPCR